MVWVLLTTLLLYTGMQVQALFPATRSVFSLPERLAYARVRDYCLAMAVRIEWMDRPADATERRIARLTALAVKAFGRADKAARWLRRPRREFGGASPLEMMETAAAARQVETLLRQLVQLDEDY